MPRPDLHNLPDWHQAFNAELERHLSLPFEWGNSDCVTVALDCIKAKTGTDLMPERGWTDEKSAKAAIKAGGGLARLAGRMLDAIHPSMAQRGDIGLWRQGLVSALVVCDGFGFTGKTETGRLRVSRDEIKTAWMTGR